MYDYVVWTIFETLKIMGAPSGREVLRLYKCLLKYGKELKLTDKNYFRNRITAEFKANKNLVAEEEVKFQYEKGLRLLERRCII